MGRKLKVAGYVKLAKLWEKRREQALEYHTKYYAEKYSDSEEFELFDVYIDITGRKEIKNRPEMLRLINDCKEGRIDCIATQTRAYLAANTGEFCSLIRYLFDMARPIHIITEDDAYNINTIINEDHQREELHRMAYSFTEMNPEEYQKWIKDIFLGIDKHVLQKGGNYGN